MCRWALTRKYQFFSNLYTFEVVVNIDNDLKLVAKIGNDLKLVVNFDNELSLKFVIEQRSLLILRHMSYSLLILATTLEKIDNE